MSALARLTMLLPFAALAACGTPSNADLAAVPVDARSQANVVGDAVSVEALAFAPGATALAEPEWDALRARLSPAALGRSHLVRVAAASPGDALSEARADWATEALLANGVTVSRSLVRLAEPGADRQGVVLELHVLRAGPPDCQGYPRVLYARIDEAASARLLGCANTANLGLMVADPADLLRGRPAGTADGALQVKAVETYRSGTGGARKEGSNPIAEAFAKAFGGAK